MANWKVSGSLFQRRCDEGLRAPFSIWISSAALRPPEDNPIAPRTKVNTKADSAMRFMVATINEAPPGRKAAARRWGVCETWWYIIDPSSAKHEKNRKST